MKKRMNSAVRAELAGAIQARYIAAPSKDKRRILEEFIAVTGYHEKSAIRVLNSAAASKRRHTSRRASLYDEAVRAALIVLREASDRGCGKRLKALLPILLPALERNGHLMLDEGCVPGRGVETLVLPFRLLCDQAKAGAAGSLIVGFSLNSASDSRLM